MNISPAESIVMPHGVKNIPGSFVPLHLAPMPQLFEKVYVGTPEGMEHGFILAVGVQVAVAVHVPVTVMVLVAVPVKTVKVHVTVGEPDTTAKVRVRVKDGVAVIEAVYAGVRVILSQPHGPYKSVLFFVQPKAMTAKINSTAKSLISVFLCIRAS